MQRGAGLAPAPFLCSPQPNTRPGGLQPFRDACRCKVRMSGLCKVEMSGFMVAGRRDGTGADRVEPARARSVEGGARGRGTAPDAGRRGGGGAAGGGARAAGGGGGGGGGG